MQPNNNQPHQPPLSPMPPEQPPQAPTPQSPVSPPLTPQSQPQSPPNQQLPQPTQPQWSQPSFYGTTAYQQPNQAPTPTLPPPPPIEGPIALTLPIWIREHLMIIIASIIGAILVLTIAFQLIYPSSHLLPGTVIDGVSLSSMRRSDAVKTLNAAYGDMQLGIYFGSNQAAFQSPKFKDVGVGVDTTSYLATLDYPWYLRIIPSSFFWAAGLSKPGEMSYVYDKAKIDSWIQSQVGSDCTIPAKDASLKLVADKLQVIPSQPGGVCDITKFQQLLATTQPNPRGNNKVTIDITEKAALVDDDKARLLGNALNDRTSSPMPMTVGSASQTISGKSVLSWLDFKSFVPETPPGQTPDEDRIRNGSKLTFTVNRDRMNTFMADDISKKIAIKAGVTKISTKDFTETSHVNGSAGRELDPETTAISIENYLNKKLDQAAALTRVVPPTITYTRSYSPTSTGFAALFAQYPQEHPGVYAVSYQEVAGVQPFRSANYRGDQAMLAAGVEAGYVGYAVALAQQDNTIINSDRFADRTALQCFNDMIEKTDLDCIAAFITKIGHETMVKRGSELGLTGTTFGVHDTKTTTNDVLLLVNKAFLTQLAVQAGGGKVLSTMQITRMRDGIPAGVKGTVSNMAGESGTVHNDAAVVYTPKGVYLLAIMSDGASRASIADLTGKIDALHNVAPPKK